MSGVSSASTTPFPTFRRPGARLPLGPLIGNRDVTDPQTRGTGEMGPHGAKEQLLLPFKSASELMSARFLKYPHARVVRTVQNRLCVKGVAAS